VIIAVPDRLERVKPSGEGWMGRVASPKIGASDEGCVPALGPAFEQLIEEQRRQGGRRLWATLMLARTLDVAESILRGRPVRVDTLDPAALRRALRGARPPAGGAYVQVTGEMLAAIDEPGGFAVNREQKR
jgi:hypothetical protein